jgi:hypothetical protein
MTTHEVDLIANISHPSFPEEFVLAVLSAHIANTEDSARPARTPRVVTVARPDGGEPFHLSYRWNDELQRNAMFKFSGFPPGFLMV